jgi:hypothetical protein
MSKAGFNAVFHDGAWKKVKIAGDADISKQYAQFVWADGKINVIHADNLDFLLGGVVSFGQYPPQAYFTFHHDGKWNFQSTDAPPHIDAKYAHVTIKTASKECVKIHADDKKFLFGGIVQWMQGGFNVIYHDGAWKRAKIAASDAVSKKYAQFVWSESKISVVHADDLNFLLAGIVNQTTFPPQAYFTLHHDGKWNYQGSDAPVHIDARYAHVTIKTASKEVVKVHADDKKFVFECLLGWINGGFDVIYHDGAWKRAKVAKEDAISKQYAQFVWKEGKINVIHADNLQFLLGGLVHFASLPPQAFFTMHHDGKWNYHGGAAARHVEDRYAHLIVKTASKEIVKAHADNKKFLFEGLLAWLLQVR